MNRQEYKNALGQLDKESRRCIKYLEGLIDEKFKQAMKVKHPQTSKAPKVDLSRLESKADSLQKQINGLRSKVDIAHNHIQDHDESEAAIKIMISRAEQVLTQINEQFEDLYHSGYYNEGTRRKIREAGLIKRK